jgi:hypothetical protein
MILNNLGECQFNYLGDSFSARDRRRRTGLSAVIPGASFTTIIYLQNKL